MEPFRPTHAEIDLNKLKKNVLKIKEAVSPAVKLMAIVKANAYGHGSVEIARAAESAGVHYFGVASLGEALELRSSSIKTPILILSETDRSHIERVLDADITQTVYTMELARLLSDMAVQKGKKAKIHIKIDTGMSRVGVLPGAARDLIEKVASMPGIELEGVFTHFAMADDMESSFTLEQFKKFNDVVSKVKSQGIHIPILHAANSAAMINFPETRLDMVRIGVCLYGLKPFEKNGRFPALEPVLSFKTKVLYVKDVPENTPVSYGASYHTSKRTRIATLPVGYADGLSRGLSNKGSVLIRGKRYPIVGNITMDMIMTETGSDKIEIGDEAVLIGRDGHEEITAAEMARLDGTISYEVVCGIGKRVPRNYRS